MQLANNTTYKQRSEHVTIPIKSQQHQHQQQQQSFSRNETSFNNSGMMTLPKQASVHIPMSFANRNDCMTLPRNPNNIINSGKLNEILKY